jgi:hypothetical protein
MAVYLRTGSSLEAERLPDSKPELQVYGLVSLPVSHHFSLNGTHARDFQSLILNFFCIFQSLIDTKRSTVNSFENILQIRQDIQSFLSLAAFAESAKHG